MNLRAHKFCALDQPVLQRIDGHNFEWLSAVASTNVLVINDERTEGDAMDDVCSILWVQRKHIHVPPIDFFAALLKALGVQVPVPAILGEQISETSCIVRVVSFNEPVYDRCVCL